MLENLLYFAISCIILVISGIFLVKSLKKIAHFLRISEFSAAFMIMALATSLPELFVGISSAISNNSSLSLGNLIGANIINLTLIIGIIILLGKEISIDSKEIKIDNYFMLTSIFLVTILYIIGKSLSRTDGVILLSFFFVNIYKEFKKRKTQENKPKKRKGKVVWTFCVFIIALIVLFLSSDYAVKYGSNLAVDTNLPKIIIGLFLLSFATTLPELVFAISATEMKHEKMGIGDSIGSVITNFTLILGVVSIISPIKAEFLPFLVSMMFLFVLAFIFITFIKTGKKLSKREGISLILIYTLFVIIELLIK